VRQTAGRRPQSSAVGVRDRLLDAADRLFYQEGVRAVGIDRVLAEADAAKASLYQHFGCKDQLVASYLERKTADARAQIERLFEDARRDPAKAMPLKNELDRLGVFKKYEDRFLDLFRRAG